MQRAMLRCQVARQKALSPWCFRATGNASANFDGFELVCIPCQTAFPSLRAWSLHAARCHGYRTAAFQLAVGRRCRACGGEYPSQKRLLNHLRCFPQCARFLEERAGSLLPVVLGRCPEQFPARRPCRVVEDSGAQFDPGVVAALFELPASATSDMLFDTVRDFILPLPMLRASIEYWAGTSSCCSSTVTRLLHMCTASAFCKAAFAGRDAVDSNPIAPLTVPSFPERFAPWGDTLLQVTCLSLISAEHDSSCVSPEIVSAARSLADVGIIFNFKAPAGLQSLRLQPGPLKRCRVHESWLRAFWFIFGVGLERASRGVPTTFVLKGCVACCDDFLTEILREGGQVLQLRFT